MIYRQLFAQGQVSPVNLDICWFNQGFERSWHVSIGQVSDKGLSPKPNLCSPRQSSVGRVV